MHTRPSGKERWGHRREVYQPILFSLMDVSTPPGVGDVNAMSSTARSRSAARAGNAPRPPKHGDVLRPPDVTADSTSHLGSAARPNPTSHHHVPDEIRPDEEHPRALGAVGNSVTLTEPHQPCSPPLSGTRRSAVQGPPPRMHPPANHRPLAEHIRLPSSYPLTPMPVPWPAGRDTDSPPKFLPPGVRAGLRGVSPG